MSKIVVTRTMYYDEYESENGDGFYPAMKCEGEGEGEGEGDDSLAVINIDFELMVYNNELIWYQKTERLIDGLDGDYGLQLLESLNLEARVNSIKIVNKIGNVLYPKKQKTN
jgi:hypothetical protein